MRLIYHCIVFVSSHWQVGNCLHCADEASHCPYPKRGRVETNLLKQEPIHVLKLGNQCTNLSKSPAALSVSSSNIFVFPFVILIPVWNNETLPLFTVDSFVSHSILEQSSYTQRLNQRVSVLLMK